MAVVETLLSKGWRWLKRYSATWKRIFPTSAWQDATKLNASGSAYYSTTEAHHHYNDSGVMASTATTREADESGDELVEVIPVGLSFSSVATTAFDRTTFPDMIVGSSG